MTWIFPGDNLAGQAWDAHRFYEPGPGELAAKGFTPVPALKVAPPQLQECRVHLECQLESVQWFGDECAFFLNLVSASADADVLTAQDRFAQLRPLFFLGAGVYGVIEESHSVKEKPTGITICPPEQHKRNRYQ